MQLKLVAVNSQSTTENKNIRWYMQKDGRPQRWSLPMLSFFMPLFTSIPPPGLTLNQGPGREIYPFRSWSIGRRRRRSWLNNEEK